MGGALNICVECEGLIVATGSEKPTSRIRQPILLMVEILDVPGRGASAEEAARTVAENVQVKTCETGHWIQLEDVEGTNSTLEQFFGEVLEKAEAK